jgi:chromate transporter
VLIALAVGAIQWFTAIQPELLALGFAAAAGVIWYARGPRALVLSVPPDLQMMLFFLKVGATLFGSGYVLVSYLQSGLVDHHGWITERQLLDAIAVGQFTPGPLLTTATFVGYLLGHTTFAGGTTGGLVGAVLATVSIFLPSFVLVAILGSMLQKLRQNKLARGALDAMNAAVVALMVVVTIQLAGSAVVNTSAHPINWFNIFILGAAIAALLCRINATWIVFFSGLLGWIVSWVQS